MRQLRAADQRLWAQVAATVRPLPGRAAPMPPTPRQSPAPATASPPQPKPEPPAVAPRPRVSSPPGAIEPNRLRRIDIGRDPVEAVIDLHGMDQDRARAALTAFLLEAAARGERTLLVITGKGSAGDGVLRRRTPEWLSQPPLRAIVAGLATAHRRRGGSGAIYVALRRTPRI